MTTVYDGFYLLDHHRNRNRQPGPAGEADTRPWYETRRICHHGILGPHLIVIHDPETLPDFTPPYAEAERVAAYGATTTRASWHDSVDADSIIPMLPATFTAWHVRGFNRCGIGLEIGAEADTWDRAPEAWLEGVIDNAARRTAQHAVAFNIPPTLLFEPGRRYTSQLDPGPVFGLIGHHPLDPTRRTDPGFTFPWDRFAGLVATYMEGDDEMIDRYTELDDGSPVLEAEFQKKVEQGVFTEHTKPGQIVVHDRLAAYLNRESQKVTKKMIAAAVAGAAAGAGVDEVIAEIVRRLGG